MKQKNATVHALFFNYICILNGSYISKVQNSKVQIVQKASLPSSFSHCKTLFHGLAAHIAGKKSEAIMISVPLHVAYFSSLFFSFLFSLNVLVSSLCLFFKNFIVGLFLSSVANNQWALSIWKLRHNL